jgi:hypothetical protein
MCVYLYFQAKDKFIMLKVLKILDTVADRWFSPGTPVSCTNNTDRHDIAEILLNVALSTMTPTILLKVALNTENQKSNQLNIACGISPINYFTKKLNNNL